jgi:hypothetical protein
MNGYGKNACELDVYKCQSFAAAFDPNFERGNDFNTLCTVTLFVTGPVSFRAGIFAGA